MTAGFRLLVSVAAAALLSAMFPTGASAQKVALLAAEFSVRADDVRAKLVGAGLTDVTVVDVSVAPTPTIDDLLQYDVVLTWTDLPYADAGALGSVLADYVDQGRGVVQAVFSFSETPSMRVEGRWRAEGYDAFTTGPLQFFPPLPLTLNPLDPDHPILSGVTAFSGGFFSFHHAGIVPQGCADVIALWSNGQPLVGARSGPLGGRIVGLNFYPVSSDGGNANFWDSATDGAILMANALRHAADASAPLPVPTGPTVALLAADDAASADAVRCRLKKLELFTQVDGIDVGSSVTPTVASLLQYDAVLTWSDLPYGDATALGSALADYVDQGGGVVQAAYLAHPAPGAALDGRWRDGGYRPFTEAPAISASGLTLLQDAPGHVIFSGVVGFISGSDSYHHSPIGLDAATTPIASWSDGEPLVAAGTGSGRPIVGINLFPPTSDARLIANALLFASNRAPATDAGVDQTFEATSPAGVSFALNATGTDPDGDSLAFAWSGPVSASGPTITVDVLPPSAPNKTQHYTVTLTASDGKGGEATDMVTLTVTDTTAPVLHDVPEGIVTAEATSAAGAEVTYGPVSAIDAVDGARPVECSPSGLFPIGDTLVTCSSSDTRENTTSASFTVRVTDVSAPGRMQGSGIFRDYGTQHHFAFRVSESASGGQGGEFLLKAKPEHGPRKLGGGADGTFAATSVDFINFSGNSVLFRGTGRWNGEAGYRFEVFAVDNGKPGPHHDWVRITLMAPPGGVVTVEGALDGGSIRSGGDLH